MEDRDVLPGSIKLIEMSTVICYLRTDCEGKAKTALENKPDTHAHDLLFKHTYSAYHHHINNDSISSLTGPLSFFS